MMSATWGKENDKEMSGTTTTKGGGQDTLPGDPWVRVNTFTFSTANPLTDTTYQAGGDDAHDTVEQRKVNILFSVFHSMDWIFVQNPNPGGMEYKLNFSTEHVKVLLTTLDFGHSIDKRFAQPVGPVFGGLNRLVQDATQRHVKNIWPSSSNLLANVQYRLENQ
jgi:hypothetical protein